MEQSKRRLIILFSLIFVLCVIAGYCDYRYYINGIEDTASEYSEEINLGDSAGVCGKTKAAASKASCKYVRCATKNNPGSCKAASPCCSWTACGGIANCKSYTVDKNGQCVCSECNDLFELKNNGRVCVQKKPTVSTCCVKTKSGGFETKNGTIACTAASGTSSYVHAGECKTCSKMEIAIPRKASPESGITISGSNEDIETGMSCSWSVNAGGKKDTLDCGPNSSCSVTLMGFSQCDRVNVTVSGPSSISGRVEIETNFSDDKKKKSLTAIDDIPSSASDADYAGKSYYGSDNDCVTNPDGTRDCMLYLRGTCDQRYNYCCVDNGTLLTSTVAEYKENQPSKSCQKGYTLLENVSKADCVINDLGSCDISDIPSPVQVGNASICEDSVSINVDSGKKCTNTVNNEKTNFYEISCVKDVSANFDYGNDGNENTIRSLYKGEGFAFGINVETKVNCKYIFYDTVWKKAYNSVKDNIRKIDSKLLNYLNDENAWKDYVNKNILNKNGITNTSKLYWYWSIAEELRNVVKTYNEYLPDDKYDEYSKITISTTEKGKDVSTTHELMRTINEEGTYKKSDISDKNLNVSGVTNPQSYNLKSDKARKVTLIPKRVCINKGTGKISTITGDKCPDNTLDGGNKIYTSFLTDVTDKNKSYPINIKVEGLGSNGSSIINNKCDLKILNNNYIYRPIDLKNPFINSSWQKGKNWVNEKFDFTKVIHEDTWSDNDNQKIISLTSKDITAIKKSNSDAWNDKNSPYMGLCISQDETLQDEITKEICNAIK